MIPEDVDDLKERIAAAGEMGLPPWMADQIKIINGVPEWCPPADKPKEAVASESALPNRKGGSDDWPRHG